MLVLPCDIIWSQLVPFTSPWLQERKLKNQFQLTYKRDRRGECRQPSASQQGHVARSSSHVKSLQRDLNLSPDSGLSCSTRVWCDTMGAVTLLRGCVKDAAVKS